MGNTEENFGKLIKALRQERQMTLRDLATITELSEAYLCRIESNERRNPTIFAVNRLRYALGIDIDVIDKVFSFEENEVNGEKQIHSIQDILLNTYSFAGKLASIEVQFYLRQIMKLLEDYVLKENNDREDELNILKLIDNLKDEVTKAM